MAKQNWFSSIKYVIRNIPLIGILVVIVCNFLKIGIELLKFSSPKKDIILKSSINYKKKILLLVPYPFYPCDGGGKIRIFNNIRSLSNFFDLHIFLIEPSLERDLKGIKEISRIYNIYLIKVEDIISKFKAIPYLGKYLYHFLSIFKKYPAYGIDCFYSKLQKIIESDYFDLIQVEHSWWYSSVLKKRRKAKLIIIEHNFEYEYWKEIEKSYKESGESLKALKTKMDSFKVKFQEREALKDADLVLCVSDRDREEIINTYGFDNVHKFHVVMSGINIKLYEKYVNFSVWDNLKILKLVYVGSLNSVQTADAGIFFIKEILPLLKDYMSRPFKLLLVGRDPIPQLVSEVDKNKEYVELSSYPGGPEEVRELIKDAHIYVIPMRYGSGIRLKVMEAMIMGKPIISTSKGVEGIVFDKCDKPGIIIEDHPLLFAKRIVELSNKPKLMKDMGLRNVKLARKYFDWDRIFLNEALPLYLKLLSENNESFS